MIKLTEKDFKDIVKDAILVYEYSPGGFPIRGYYTYSNQNDLDKVCNRISKLNNLSTLIKRDAASKLIFGTNIRSSPYDAYTERAIKLGLNVSQKSDIDNITWDKYEDIKKEYFPKFNYKGVCI